MFRVLVISDSHGKNEDVRAAVEDAGKIDVMIHLGDICCDSHQITNMAGVPTYMVRGNCDSDWSLMERNIIVLGGHRIYATHGHTQRVEYGTDSLMQTAIHNGCDIAMYGHTHVPFFKIYEESEGQAGITILNPGSISKPRQEGFERSYVIMTIADDGQVNYELKHLPGKRNPWEGLKW